MTILTETAQPDPQTPPPPSQELVPAPGGELVAPVPPGAEADVDPSRLIAISEQVLQDAAKRGRPDLEGLCWRNQGGLVYEIIDHDSIDFLDRREHRDSLARELLTGQIRPRWESSVKGGPYIGRPQEKDIRLYDAQSQRWTVGITGADGLPADIISFSDGELAAFLDNPTGEAIPDMVPSRPGEGYVEPQEWFTGFVWKDPDQKPPRGRESIAIDMEDEIGNSKGPLFDTIMEDQERLGLKNWEGLTWTINDGVRQKVTEDLLLYEGPEGNKRPVRAWVIKTYGRAANPIGQHVYKDDELKNYLNQTPAKGGHLVSDLHWNLPKIREAATPPVIPALGRTALGFVIEPTSEHGPIEGPEDLLKEAHEDELTPDQAKELLSYHDVLPEDEDSPIPEDFWDSPETEKYIEALRSAVDEVGKRALLDVCKRLVHDHEAALRQLGFEPKPEDASTSWVLWALTKQRIDSGQTEIEEMLSGVKKGNPLADNEEGRRKQNEIIDSRLGQVFASSALKVIPGKKVLAKKEDKQVLLKLPGSYRINEPAVNAMRLPELIKPDVLEILYKVTRDKKDPLEDRQLHEGDFVEIGRLLRRTINR